MKTRKIMFNFDMDGVVFNWDKKLSAEIEKQIPHLRIKPRREHEHWDFATNYSTVVRERINGIWQAPGFYQDLELIEGAKEAYDMLLDRGCKVCFVSTPSLGKESGHSMKEKFECLWKHFGEEAANSLILTRDKTLVRGHFLIDDKTEIKGECTPSFTHLVFDEEYLYNRHVPPERKINWHTFEKRLPELFDSLY